MWTLGLRSLLVTVLHSRIFWTVIPTLAPKHPNHTLLSARLKKL